MRLRKIPLLDQLVLVSASLLLLLVALTVNRAVNQQVVDLQTRLVRVIEDKLQLRVSFDRFRFLSFQEVELVNVQLVEFTNDLELPHIRAKRLRVKVDAAAALSGTGDPLSLLRRISLEQPEIYLYGRTTPLLGNSSRSGSKSREGVSPPLLLQDLPPDFELEINNGRLLWFADKPVQESERRAVPAIAWKVDRLTVQLSNYYGSFRLQSHVSVMEQFDLFQTGIAMNGIFSLREEKLQLQLGLENLVMGGVPVPPMRFYANLENGTVDFGSAPFRQPVKLSGSWRPGGSGSLQLEIDKSSKMFSAEQRRRRRRRVSKPVFFLPDKDYRPAGQIAVTISPQQLTYRGAVAVQEEGGRTVFRMQVLGSDKAVIVRELRLAQQHRLIDAAGQWVFSRDFPEFRLTLRNVPFLNSDFGGTLFLGQIGNGGHYLRLQDLTIDGAVFGTVSSSLYPTRYGGYRFVSAGLPGNVLVNGYFHNGNDFQLSLLLQNAGAAAPDNLAGFGGIFDPYAISGTLKLSSVDGAPMLGGRLNLVNPRSARDYILADAEFRDGKLKLGNFYINGLQLALSGMIYLEPDSGKLDLVMAYAGNRYRASGNYIQKADSLEFEASIGDIVVFRSEFGAVRTRMAINLNRFPVQPFGFPGLLSVSTVLSYGDIPLSLQGSVQLQHLVPGNGLMDSFRSAVAVSGRNIALTGIELENLSRKLTGSGSVRIFPGVVAGELRLADKKITLSLESGAQGVSGRLRLRPFDLSAYFPPVWQGTAAGDLAFRWNRYGLMLDGSLQLVKGSMSGIPVSFDFKLQPAGGWVRLVNSSMRFGALQCNAMSGQVMLSADEVSPFSLNGRLEAAGGPFALVSRFDLQGRLERDGSLGALLRLPRPVVNKVALQEFSVMAGLQHGILQLVRKARGGISGFYNFNSGVFSGRIYQNGMLLAQAGSKRTADGFELFAGTGDDPLQLLKFFPGVFRRASGKGSVQLLIKKSRNSLSLDGKVEIDGGVLDTPFLADPLRDLSVRMQLQNGRIRLERFKGRSGGGELMLHGGAYLRNDGLEDMDLRIRTDRKEGIRLNLASSSMRIAGKALTDLFFKGDMQRPLLQGRVAVKDMEFSYLPDGSPSGPETFFDRINWDVEFTILDNVSYQNSLVTAWVKPQSSIRFRNRMADRDFQITGRVDVMRGSVDYINRQFRIEQPTYLDFKRRGEGFEPWLSFKGKTAMKDENLDSLTVYMTYNGPLSGSIKPVFYSEPSRTEKEIKLLLGLESQSDDNGQAAQQNNLLMQSSELLTLLGLRPVSQIIKKKLKLDLFSIRTPLVRNLLEGEAFNPAVFRDTQFSLGKYLTSFLFVEYTLTLKESSDRLGDLLPAHQLGLEFDLSFINLGYFLAPTEQSSYRDYEHSFQLRFRRRF